jgi:OmcA/MtrC family decaheme c-type cytochrome
MRSRFWPAAIVAAIFLALAGCAEKQGADGPAGATGATGADFSLATANETCAACHGRGMVLDAATGFNLDGTTNSPTGVHNPKPVTNPAGLTQILLNASVTQVTLTGAGDATMVVGVHVTKASDGTAYTTVTNSQMRLAFAELKDPATSGVAEWVNYFKSASSGFPTYVAGNTTSLPFSTGQGTGTTNGSFTNSGAGDYLIGFTTAATGLKLKTTTHRVAIQISLTASATIPSGSGTGVNGWAEFVPSAAIDGVGINTGSATVPVGFTAWGPGTAYQAASAAAPANHLVDTANCNECHQGISAHGGTRRTVEFCILCHNGGDGGTAYTTTTTEGHSIDWKQMLHKLHYGKELPSVQAGGTYAIGSADFSTGGFPQSMSNCMKCHGDASAKTYRNPGLYSSTIPGKTTLVTGSITGDAVTGWTLAASKEACLSCHDRTSFATTAPAGYTQHMGGAITGSTAATVCQSCHDPDTGGGSGTPKAAIAWAHGRQAQTTVAATYFCNVEKTTYTAPTASVAGSLVVDYSVSTGGNCTNAAVGSCTSTVGSGGARVDLTADPAFTVTTGLATSRLQLNIGYKDRWTTTSFGADYTNDGAGDGTTPGMPKAVNALQIGGAYPVQPVGTNAEGLYRYTYTIAAGTPGTHADPIPNAGTGIAMLEGHPVKTLPSSGGFARTIPVESAYAEFKIRDSSYTTTKRRPVVNVAKCQECHNSLSIHGDNRTASTRFGIGACTSCHNSANTDISVRPSNPALTADGLKEQTIDMKFMVHRIHKGRDLTYNFEIFGYGGSENEFGGEFPPGRVLSNCQNCHYAAGESLTVTGGVFSGTVTNDTNTLWLPDGIQGTTIDSGADRVSHADDLNISPNSAVCSTCHDSDGAKSHMKLQGGSFSVLQSNIEFY